MNGQNNKIKFEFGDSTEYNKDFIFINNIKFYDDSNGYLLNNIVEEDDEDYKNIYYIILMSNYFNYIELNKLNRLYF